ncbi:MAG: hypothetical protein H0V17_08860 [Deltaproteobacteria bacterium]|nr:hypothetical protein [Deltaproteobacteria bacterium]
MRYIALLLVALACGSPELDYAKAVVEAEAREDLARSELAKIERELSRLDVEIEVVRTKSTTDAERENAKAALDLLAKERKKLEGALETQQAAVREAEVAARKVRIQSKQ